MSNDAYQMVTDRIIALLDEGVVPWQAGWVGSGPLSMSSRKSYHGVNAMILPFLGHASRWWGTYNRIRELGGQVRKGEHATFVVFWKFLKVKDEDDPTARTKTVPMLRYFNVFNADQAEWPNGRPDWMVESAQPEAGDAGDDFTEAEAIVARYLQDGGPTFVTRTMAAGESPCYIPRLDRVEVPLQEQYNSLARWYRTVFHELGHSTGAAKRLARPGVTDPIRFGSHQYSREELVAELTACFLGDAAGVGIHDEANSAAYLASWKSFLTDDPRALVVAAGAAQKAANLVLGIKAEYENETTTEEVAA